MNGDLNRDTITNYLQGFPNLTSDSVVEYTPK